MVNGKMTKAIFERVRPSPPCLAKKKSVMVHIDFFPGALELCGILTFLIFLLLENFTNSDRMPPYVDTHLQLFPNFGNSGNNISDKNEH